MLDLEHLVHHDDLIVDGAHHARGLGILAVACRPRRQHHGHLHHQRSDHQDRAGDGRHARSPGAAAAAVDVARQRLDGRRRQQRPQADDQPRAGGLAALGVERQQHDREVAAGGDPRQSHQRRGRLRHRPAAARRAAGRAPAAAGPPRSAAPAPAPPDRRRAAPRPSPPAWRPGPASAVARRAPARSTTARAAPAARPPKPSSQYSTTVDDALVPAHDGKLRQARPAARQQRVEARHRMPQMRQHRPLEPPVVHDAPWPGWGCRPRPASAAS